jgi:site-specific DNA recombinase
MMSADAMREPAHFERVACYLRVSSAEQKRNATIDTQRGILDRWATAQDVQPVGWYEDAGVSGAIAFAARPAGGRLTADIRSGHVRYVVVTAVSRFGRNTREVLNAVYEIEQAGARLISLKENVDTRTIMGRALLNTMATFAQLEREMIAERAEDGMTDRLTTTAYMGGRPPIGYHVEGKKKDAWLVLNDTPDPSTGYSEPDVVRLAWHLSVEQGMCTLDIANRLTDMGIPTRQGKQARWQESVVWQMLTNPTIKGERTYTRKDGTRYVEPVPAIPTLEQWERLQAALAEHKRASTRNEAMPFLLRDLLRCGVCGESYAATYCELKDHSGKKYGHWRHYACTRRLYARLRQRRGEPFRTCIGRAVDAEKLEALVWADVEQFIRDPGPILHQLAAQVASEQEGAAETRARLTSLEAQAAAFQAERDSILTLFRKGRITERDLDRQMDGIEREEGTLRKERATVVARMEGQTATQDRLTSARALLQRLHARLDNGPLSPETRQEIVRALVADIRVDTVQAGMSRRGTVKYAPKVHVSYVFDAPTAQAPTASQALVSQAQDVTVTTCRCRP